MSFDHTKSERPAANGASDETSQNTANVAQPDYGCTLLKCDSGYRATKLYRGDAMGKPEDYAAGKYFRPFELPADGTFDDLVDALAGLASDVYMIRGQLKECTREKLRAGAIKMIRRLSNDHPDDEATCEPVARNWAMFDLDKRHKGKPWTNVPFHANDIEGSVRAMHALLPNELCIARSAFILSSSSHRKPTVVGHLFVDLAQPLDNVTAEHYASALGFDGSVCRTVQPNYCAAPIFVDCVDALAGRRAPIRFDGEPAKLTFGAAAKKARSDRAPSGVEPIPAELPPPSADAQELAVIIHDRWLDGGRIETLAWLHMAGWLLGARWDKGEIGALLVLIDAEEPDASKREEHRRNLRNAHANDGPGGAREWLGDDFAAVDEIVNRKRNAWMKDSFKHDAAEKPKRPVPLEMTDTGNARRLVEMFGARLRYCRARRKWYVWSGALWQDDEKNAVEAFAKEAAESLWEAANEFTEESIRGKARLWAARSLDCNRIRNMIALAESEPGVAVAVAELDADPWLLNVTNGTLNLKTGQLTAPDPRLHMTKCCATNYNPTARSDLWDTFILRTTNGDADLAAYIQRALGYALVGAWHEKSLWFGYGDPDGGKSTFLGAVGDVLGSYHVAANANTWMVQHGGGNRGDVTRLLGARLVTTMEIRRGMRFDEALVKSVTGGDKITAAAKYEADIEFAPTFALWMGANDRPIIRDDDDGMWARMRCVPFTNPVPKSEQDPYLRNKLLSAEHAPAILRWMVDGCEAWQRERVGACDAVTLASAAYKQSMNCIAGFVDEVLIITRDPKDEVPASRMRSAYDTWCRDTNVRHPLSPKAFGQKLREFGMTGGDDSTRHKVGVRQGSFAGWEPQGSFAGREPQGSFAGGQPRPFDRHWQGVKLTRDAA